MTGFPQVLTFLIWQTYNLYISAFSGLSHKNITTKGGKTVENNVAQDMLAAKLEKDKDDIFEPVLGEVVSDDSFAFTLLSCHCSGNSTERW